VCGRKVESGLPTISLVQQAAGIVETTVIDKRTVISSSEKVKNILTVKSMGNKDVKGTQEFPSRVHFHPLAKLRLRLCDEVIASSFRA